MNKILSIRTLRIIFNNLKAAPQTKTCGESRRTIANLKLVRFIAIEEGNRR